MKTRINLTLQLILSGLFLLSITSEVMACNNDRPRTNDKVVVDRLPLATGAEEKKRELEVVRDVEMEMREEGDPAKKDGSLAGERNITGEFDFENGSLASVTSANGFTVSKWLEARVVEEIVITRAGNSKSSVEPPQEEFVGGGWCNWCGCWMRHGCDPNGNCVISHLNACASGLGCYLHQGECISTN